MEVTGRRPTAEAAMTGVDDITYRVGVDVGGTFTDVVCTSSAGDLVLDKALTTTEDRSRGVMDALGQLALTLGIGLKELCGKMEVFVHGSTVVDNTMIEMDGSPTGMLVTEGHRDEIELRRVHKEQIWDPAFPPPVPIARRRARIPIPERIDFEGTVVEPLDEEAVRRGARRLRALGVRSVAIAFLFSFVNPGHERRARELLLEEFPDVEHVSLSHEVLPRAPEFERMSTTLVNAYVAPRVASYVGRLVERLRSAGFGREVVLMQATGGVMPPAYAERHAVGLLGSGPTGGVMGAAFAARLSGVEDFVAVDMGGTSYDVCLVRGTRPEVSVDWNWRHRYYIGLPMVDVHAVGAGGGSVARVRQGALLVGPESAGSDPGPACYGRGGGWATVTDADCVLGYLPVDRFAAGRMRLDAAAAAQAIERDVAGALGLDVDEAAWAVERVVNANMSDAVRKVVASHGADPRELSMIAYGGNGPVHAWLQARELGMRRVLVPKPSPAFSALGLLVADYVVDLVRAYVTPLARLDDRRVALLMGELADEAMKELAPSALDPAAISHAFFLDMCYQGQNFDLRVPVADWTRAGAEDRAELVGRFHAEHERERGFASPSRGVMVRGVRLVSSGTTPKPGGMAPGGGARSDAGEAEPGVALVGVRPVHMGDGFQPTPVYDGSRLGADIEIVGPALLEEPFTVVVLGPGDVATLDEHGTYDIRIAP